MQPRIGVAVRAGSNVGRHYGTRGFAFMADDMSSIPHPKRELLKLCARIGYTPH